MTKLSLNIENSFGKGRKFKLSPSTLFPDIDNFTSSVELSFITQDGSAIYYTLDGSVPSILKTKYTAPFIINSTTIIKWINILSPYTSSNIMTRTITKI